MGGDIPRQAAGEEDDRKAIETNPQSAQAYYELGLLLEQDPARVGEAEAAYRQAIELEPEAARYVYRQGLFLHEQLGRVAEAENAYRRSIALAPDDPFVYGGLVTLLVEQSRHAEAVTVSTAMRALLMARENWYGLATLDAILGNVDDAVNYLREAAKRADFNRTWARRDPDLANLRDDPRFGEVIGDKI